MKFLSIQKGKRVWISKIETDKDLQDWWSKTKREIVDEIFKRMPFKGGKNEE